MLNVLLDTRLSTKRVGIVVAIGAAVAADDGVVVVVVVVEEAGGGGTAAAAAAAAAGRAVECDGVAAAQHVLRFELELVLEAMLDDEVVM